MPGVIRWRIRRKCSGQRTQDGSVDPQRYTRTPLPAACKAPLGWIALWFGFLIFGPFLGFTLTGRVDAAGLAIGLAPCALGFIGLATIVVMRWRAWRQLPPQVRAEWQTGKVVQPAALVQLDKPLRVVEAGRWYEVSNQGLLFSRNSLLRIQASEMLARSWVIEQAGQYFIPWNEIVECVVNEDSDGPDEYRLVLRQEGSFSVRRMRLPDLTECGLLDLVRNVGRVPIRLRTDVGCASSV